LFKSARLKLTIIYCLVFFSILWLFSFSLYFWMERSYGEAYISKVKNQQIELAGDLPFNSKSEQTVTIAGDVALGQLKRTLLVLNGGLIVIIPGLAWLLTKRTLQPIEETYDNQKQFVSDASHELRTPLTIMKGEIDLALRRPRNTAEYTQVLTSTREEVGRLEDLTDSLLYIARSDQRRVTMPMGEIDIVDVIIESVSYVQPLAKANKLTLSFDPPPANLRVRGSTTTLKQLFTNLLENAIKFTPKKGSITVSAEPSDKVIKIFVVDTGIGMKSTAVAQAFERFYRDDVARTQKGFGLGLAICKTIVEQHNGTITLGSKPDKGTTVTITLPKA